MLNQNGGLDLANKHVHFVGIGGCGMSGLSRIVQSLGAICNGSDMTDSSVVAGLIADGIPVVLEQTAASVPATCDLLVISAAIKDDHPEVIEAHRREIPVIKYAQLLGKLMIGRCGIAIAGTHGKSTTTSMLCHILIEAKLDPNFIVGANCAQIGGGARVSQSDSDMLLAEACEFDRSFHNFHPTHAAILNVEEDHLDIYKNLDEIIEAFHIFAKKIPAHGSLLIQHAFNQLNLHRVYCGTLDTNIGMKKLAVKFGMQEEGRRRDAIYKNGEYVDIVEFGILNARGDNV